MSAVDFSVGTLAFYLSIVYHISVLVELLGKVDIALLLALVGGFDIFRYHAEFFGLYKQSEYMKLLILVSC